MAERRCHVRFVPLACLAPPNRGSFNSTHVYGTHVPVEEPSTASKADICSAANSSLFDHLVGASKHRLRNCEFYCFGSLEIDYKLVLRRRLHGKIGWLLTFEDAIDVASSAVEQVDGVRPIGDQATSGDEVSVKKDRR